MDMVGRKFGRLTVERGAYKNGRGLRLCDCLCECGERRVVQKWALLNGTTRSCGCLHREITSRGRFHTTHGMHASPLYSMWCSIKARCATPSVKAYPDYGGRGIRVCERWRDSFAAFVSDMGERPEGYEIDRIDNDGHYEPGNCRWVPRIVNARNKRNTVRATIDGVTRSIYEWEPILGVSAKILRDRIQRGWPPQELSRPPKKRSRHV